MKDSNHGSRSHEVPAAHLAHLYQALHGLHILIREMANDLTSGVQIEVLDDVALVGKPETLSELRQVKSRSGGRLTETSPDFWNTLATWLDRIDDSDHRWVAPRFILYTTQGIGESSSLWRLCCDCPKRDIELALASIKKAASQSSDKSTALARERFVKLTESRRSSFIRSIYIEAGQPQYDSVSEQIKRELRLAGLANEPLAAFYDALLGWWHRRLSTHLLMTIQGKQDIILVDELRIIYNDKRSQFNQSTLYIDPEIRDATVQLDDFEEKTFLKQLALITNNSEVFRLAVRDYFRAYEQRTKWIADELSCVDELERYEATLLDEWQHHFSLQPANLDEAEKRHQGSRLFQRLSSERHAIRPDLLEMFVQRGTLHGLADELRIGWHPDFLKRLKGLLETAG